MPPVSTALIPSANPGYRDNAPGTDTTFLRQRTGACDLDYRILALCERHRFRKFAQGCGGA